MFFLPKLNYEYNSLEPYISRDVMEIHHSKHHQIYVDTLNKLVSDNNLTGKSLKSLLFNNRKEDLLSRQIKDYGGGHYNHSIFWLFMTPSKKNINKKLEEVLSSNFKSVNLFKEEFSTKAAKLFGSGWVWLISENNVLSIKTSENQDNPMMKDESIIPLLCLDVWEHAYYLQYKNKRKEYIDQWWNIVDWDLVYKIYQNCVLDKKGNVNVSDSGELIIE